MPRLISNANVSAPLRKLSRPARPPPEADWPASPISSSQATGELLYRAKLRAGEWEVASHDFELDSYYITLRASSTPRLGPNFRQSRLVGCGDGLCRPFGHLPAGRLRSLTTVSSPRRIARVSSPKVAMGCHCLPALEGAVRTLIGTGPTLLFDRCGYLVEAKGARSVAT